MWNGHFYIPVAGSDEVVAVPVDELPEEAEDLLDILKAEEAPLALWLDFAKAYLAQVPTAALAGECLVGPPAVLASPHLPARLFCDLLAALK